MLLNGKRNKSKTERRNRILTAGFQLFSIYGIENVSLEEVARTADIGPATLYRYFSSKLNLVAAISTKIWEDVWRDALNSAGLGNIENADAYQSISLYCDAIIEIYRKHPEVLRFDTDFRAFVRKISESNSEKNLYRTELEPLQNEYCMAFVRFGMDNSIRTDISKARIISTIMETMFVMAERYTLDTEKNHFEEHQTDLQNLKDMILLWISDQKEYGRKLRMIM